MPGQHDYEPQPEAPDEGASVQLETAESLLGPPGGDGLDSGYVPPDRPYLLDEDRRTSAELAEPESISERVARERPDPAADPAAAADADADPDADTAWSAGPDADPDADPDAVPDGETDVDRAGRLTAATADPDGLAGNSIDAQDSGVDGGAASAEEAAVHRTDPPRW